jgi:hypothetical protein
MRGATKMDNETAATRPSTPFDPELVARLLAALHAQWGVTLGKGPGIPIGKFDSPLQKQLKYFIRRFTSSFDIVDRRGYQLQAVIAQNLTRALEPMQATDAILVNLSMRKDLYRALIMCGTSKSTFYSPGLAKALLHALAFVGDKQAMDYIDHIAQVGFVDTFHESVCVAAVHSRDVIRERLERERQGETLLRPAQYSPADTLLHPINAGNVVASQDLLRPAHQPSSNNEENRTP